MEEAGSKSPTKRLGCCCDLVDIFFLSITLSGFFQFIFLSESIRTRAVFLYQQCWLLAMEQDSLDMKTRRTPTARSPPPTNSSSFIMRRRLALPMLYRRILFGFKLVFQRGRRKSDSPCDRQPEPKGRYTPFK